MKANSLLAVGLSSLALSLGVLDTSAAVTPYSWIRFGEGGGLFNDSSGQNHPFNAGFSSGPGTFGGDPGAVISVEP